LEDLPPGSKIVNVPITVAGLADQIEKTTSQVIMALMKLGIMANINQNIDEDTVVLLGEELGVNIVVGKVDKEIVDEGLELFKDKDEELKSRAPIIAVMGHVDRGMKLLPPCVREELMRQILPFLLLLRMIALSHRRLKQSAMQEQQTFRLSSQSIKWINQVPIRPE